MQRRNFLLGLGALIAAPAVIRTPGLLMPVRPSLLSWTELFTPELVQQRLADLAIRGTIYDWVVTCDERNNTSDVVERGELVIDLAIRPMRSSLQEVHARPRDMADMRTLEDYVAKFQPVKERVYAALTV